jgi:UDP-N-acetylglucosamine--N-acetylmuramyl-(pentapeptide) pyrophosphoryl-undecaprenol N-acetylglucosamine transferase
MSQPRKKIIISGGGTGGHIFPAVAIADALKQRLEDPDILFIGAKGRMEMVKVPKAGYKIEGLWISGIQRKLTLKNLSFPFKLISSILKAKKIMRRFKPDVAIGTGGYASGPMLRVASKKGIPSLIQEQNSFPGITNRILSKTVNKICVAFEGMEKYFPPANMIITGNPVRQDIIDLEGKREKGISFFELQKGLKTILIVGGSQGARSINQGIGKILDKLLELDIQFVWQCGKAFYPTAMELKASLKSEKAEKLKVFEFIYDMDLAYAACDIVISRAGAIAISELCIAGKPLILVPLPSAAEDHQTKNALALVEKNAAIIVRDYDIDNQLYSSLTSLITNQEMQNNMSENIKGFARPEATEKIVDEIINLLDK